MVIIGRRRTFLYYAYFGISFVLLMTLISPNKSLQIVQPAIAQSKSIHHLCIFGLVAICLDTTPVITPQISTNTSATTKAPASVSAPPSLEELAGENVTKAPANVTAAKAKMGPANIPQLSISTSATTKAPSPPSLEELAGQNVTATPPQITNVTKTPANVTAPSTNATEHNKNEPIPQL